MHEGSASPQAASSGELKPRRGPPLRAASLAVAVAATPGRVWTSVPHHPLPGQEHAQRTHGAGQRRHNAGGQLTRSPSVSSSSHAPFTALPRGVLVVMASR